MSTNLTTNAVSRLASQADAVARLAQDAGGFSAVVAAFESQDANAFRWVLDRLEMLPYCELICEWVRVKLCALRCAEICIPVERTDLPSLQEFARAVVRLSANEEVMRRVTDALSCGDGSEYRAALDELQLGGFCQLLCYWICSVGYDRVCEVVCRAQPVAVSDAASTLSASGQALANVVKNDKALDAIAKAAVSLDCELVQSTITQAGLAPVCEILLQTDLCLAERMGVPRGVRSSPADSQGKLRYRRSTRIRFGRAATGWATASSGGSGERRVDPQRRRL